MQKSKRIIAFDVDGTLIYQVGSREDTPRYDVIDLLRWFISRKDIEIVIWSGGGIEYAQRWKEKLGLPVGIRVIEKGSEKVDIAIDDEEVKLGKVNIQV